MPRLLSDILIEKISHVPDLEVVADLPGDTGLAGAVETLDVDAVVLGIRGGEVPAACEPVVRRHPRLRVLAIDDGGRRSFLYELRPQTVALGEISPETVVAALRRA